MLSWRKRRNVALLLAGGAALVFAAAAFLSDTVTVTLGEHRFEIPKTYSRQGSMPKWIADLSGLDNGSRAYLLEFPAEEVAQAVPGYQAKDGRYVEVIRAILNVLHPYEVARYRDRERYRDLWERIGTDKERIIEPYRDSQWFRVYPRLDRSFGTVVRLSPETGERMPEDPLDFWVASCRSGNSPITETGKVESCLTYAFYDDIAIEFYISGQNLQLIDEVRSYLKAKVESWKVRR